MNAPQIVLGIELMDCDHLRIERMFDAASRAPDQDLPALHRDVTAALAEHFTREAELLRDNGFPGLHCHVAQHNMLLAELASGGTPKAGAIDLRRLLQVIMPQLVSSHVATMDRMAAAYLNGELGQADFDNLRLPLPVSAA
jgi:hemerythrin